MGLDEKFRKRRNWQFMQNEKRVILVLGDFLTALVSLIIATLLWAQADWLQLSTEFLQKIPGWFYLLPFIWLLLLIELYDPIKSINKNDTFRGLIVSALISFGLYLLVYFTSEPNSLPRRGVSVFIVCVFLMTLIWRLIYIRIFSKTKYMRRALIIGAGRAGTRIAQVIKSKWPPPFYVVGLIDDDTAKHGDLIEGFPVLTGSDKLIELALNEGVSDLIFAITKDLRPEIIEAIMKAEEMGIRVNTMPVVYENLLGRVPITLLESDWLLRSFIDVSHSSGFFDIGKRLLDILGGLVGMIGLALVLPFVAILTVLDSGFPIFYSQDRIGENGKPFRIIKFRTMIRNAEKNGKPQMTVENDQRITRVGNLLRKSHIDEIPQFINVILGDISLAGPRAERLPLIEQYSEQIPFYRARLFVKPGLTGWAQVNYGYASTIEDTITKLEYDLYYIKHRNLLMEISILLRTVGTVIGLRGR